MDKTTANVTQIKQAIQQMRDFGVKTPNMEALLKQLLEDVRELEELLRK